jgi:glycosyltransferase involved in cell wall biosynthesis
MNIYMNVAENSGVGYYRIFLPALALIEAGHKVLINDFTWGENRIFCKDFGKCDFISRGYDNVAMVNEFSKHLEEAHEKIVTPAERNQIEQSIIAMVDPDIETLSKIGRWADIIVFGRKDTPDYLSTWGGLREFFNIPIVLDTDDNINAVRPFNPGYRGYHPGSEALIWNKRTVQQVDAVTVSTENLKNVNLKDNKHIYVLPNSLEMERWEKIVRPEHDEVRIGCLLSSAHHEDAKLLEKVIPAILEKYSQAHFYYTGMFDYIFASTREKFPDQMHIVPWIPLKDWPEQVVGLGLDIGLAPLVDNFFNRAKSNLRYLEYSASKMATVASPVEPYKIITDGKGLLASTTEEWIDHISSLIEDKKKRTTIATNAFKFVKKNFDSKKNAKLFIKAYTDIIKNYQKFKGKPKSTDKPTFSTSSIN